MAAVGSDEVTSAEIMDYLVQSGFSIKEIERAIEETGSKDIDFLVNFIIERRGEVKKLDIKQRKVSYDDSDVKKMEELLKKRKEELYRDKQYKESLVRKISADMCEKREREQIEDKQMMSMSTETENTEVLYDCRIKLWASGSFFVLGFSKDATVEELFNKAEAVLNRKKFNLFRMSLAEPIEKSGKRLCEVSWLYPTGVLFVGE